MTVNRVAYGDLSGLPRSVRWRIQLGLFVDPSTQDPTATTTLESCLQWNSETIAQQNSRFQELMTKYIEEEEEVTKQEEAATTEASPPAPVMLDPLTAMVREQEEKESRKAELYLKYRKEKARRKRGLANDGGFNESGENDGIDRASVRKTAP